MSNIPSIAMIPSAYKSGKVYSVLPTDGSGDLNFTRASEATRVNKDGFVENVGVDIPRLDYSDGGCPSLLLEPASTNLYDYSEDLALYGSRVGLDLEADSSLSPDGSLNADLLTEDTSTGSHVLRKTSGPTTTAGLDYSFSFFVKANGRDIVALSNNAGTASAIAFFNLTSGSILSSTFDSASMVDYGNGWWRIETTHEATGTGDYEARIYTSVADGSFTHTGDGTSGLYIWGLQLEQRSYATSYIPTNGSAVTRVAETCNGAGNEQVINSTEGVLYVEIKRPINQLETSQYLGVSDGSTDNRFIIGASAASPNLRFIGDMNGVRVLDVARAGFNKEDWLKIAIVWDLSEFKIFINGTKNYETTLSDGFTPNILNTFEFASGSKSSVFYGISKDVKIYNTALTDQELISLTS